MASRSLRDMAVEYTAGSVAATFDADYDNRSLRTIALELVRRHDPTPCAGVNSEGAEILFNYSFDLSGDIDAIVSRARDIIWGDEYRMLSDVAFTSAYRSFEAAYAEEARHATNDAPMRDQMDYFDAEAARRGLRDISAPL